MILPFKPTSNAERQRQFRERNPGYYRKYSARLRELQKACTAQRLAEAQSPATKREPLMLPAPVETIEIPGMNMIPGKLTMPALSPVSVSERLTIPIPAAKSLAA